MIDNHLLAELPEGDYVLDTGSPVSIGESSSIELSGIRVSPLPEAGGISPGVLSEHIGHNVTGLIGLDLLAKLDVLFDVAEGAVEFSSSEIKVKGEILPLRSGALFSYLVEVSINDRQLKFLYDTGAKLSYLKEEYLGGFRSAGVEPDFFMSARRFQVDTFTVPTVLGRIVIPLRCGVPTPEIKFAMDTIRIDGILGTGLMIDRKVLFSPQRMELVLC